MTLNVYSLPASITKPPLVKTGGLCAIRFCRRQDVLTFPSVNVSTGIIDDDIVLKDGASWYECQAVDQGRAFQENMVASPSGPLWTQEITGTVPGSFANLLLALHSISFDEFIILATDRSGETRLIGNTSAGASIEVKYTSGDIKTTRKNDIRFLYMSAMPSPIYQGVLADVNNGIISTSGQMVLVQRFKVGQPGAPMNGIVTTYTNGLIKNRKVLVFQDGQKVTEYTDGITIENYITKNLTSDTITWSNGAPGSGSIIEVYAN